MKLKVALIFLFACTCNFVSLKALREEEMMKLSLNHYTLMWVNTLTEYILSNERYKRDQTKAEDFLLRRGYILSQFKKFRRVGRAKSYFARNDVYKNTLRRRSLPPPIKLDLRNDVQITNI
ncbi:GSCOCG00011017001-RA-CDS [Cotesia congregata]|uniref:Uncharacterized protein n=1 Tax=Cotesia congregata TaxID=51543 RepID=A0A8J2HPR1_COTCN|nr:GSCOCG00011017001-RA-CDS [Cotesia congregata]CAG5102622.1 Protein of unknown function [Cotesia congregata]